MISNTFIIRPCAAATYVQRLPDLRNMCDGACALRERLRARCAMCEDRRRCPGFRALPCYLLLPIVPPGSRAAVRRLSPQVRGGRCRSSAARAKCRWHNGFHGPTGCAVRKYNRDAFRRLVLTPDAAGCKARQHLPLNTLECAPAPPVTTEDDSSIADRVHVALNTFVPVRLAPLGDAWRPYRMIEAYSFADRLPGAWRCNTLRTRIVFAGTGRIGPPAHPVRARSSPSPEDRPYRWPGGGAGPRRPR